MLSSALPGTASAKKLVSPSYCVAVRLKAATLGHLSVAPVSQVYLLGLFWVLHCCHIFV